MPSGDSASVRMGFSSDGFTLKEKPRRNKFKKENVEKEKENVGEEESDASSPSQKRRLQGLLGSCAPSARRA